MPDNVKMMIVEKNGVELKFHEEKEFVPGEMPFSDPSYQSDNVEDAIIESASTGGQSRYVVSCGYESTVQNGRWLEFHRGNPSNTTPYVATESTELISLSFSIPSSKTSVTVEIFKNGVSFDTVVLSNSTTATKTFVTVLSLAVGDELSIQKSAGNNPSAITAYPHFKVPFS